MIRTRTPLSVIAALSLVVVIAAARAADEGWPRFRGPNGAGVSDAKTVPTAVTDRDVRWKVDLGGEGHSSPVVWGNRLYITASDRGTAAQRLLCLDADSGKTLWVKSFASAPFPLHQFNSFASATCAVDAQRVYVTVESNKQRALIALTHMGEEAWRYVLGPFDSQHGTGASPMVYRDMVVMTNDQRGASYVVALEAATGKERWKVPRPALDAAYATPCVIGDSDQERLVFASQAAGLTAVDPATGTTVWQIADLFPKRVVSSPLVADGRVIVACGQGGSGEFLVAVTPAPGAADGKATIAWKVRKAAPYVPTSVYHAGSIFTVSDGGIASCLDPATGEPRWQQRLGGDYFASPVIVDSVVYAVSREGQLVTYRAAADRYEEVARSDLGEPSNATPAVANGRMYLRTLRHLICIGGQPLAQLPLP